MATIAMWNFTQSELTAFANQVKEVVILGLEKEDLLDGEVEDISGKYAVVVLKKGTLGLIWDKLRGAKEDAALITFVKGIQ